MKFRFLEEAWIAELGISLATDPPRFAAGRGPAVVLERRRGRRR